MSDATPDDEAVADPYATAIDALTVIARQTRTVAGREEYGDFAGALAGIVSSVAANVGGTEPLLFGRSGSWEADLVRSLVNGTVGWDGEQLPGYRTEPIPVLIDPEAILQDHPTLEWDDAWETRMQAVSDAVDVEYERVRDALEAAGGLLAEHAATVAAAFDMETWSTLTADQQVAAQRAADALHEHARTDPGYAAALAAVQALEDERRAAEVAYGEALLAAAQARAVELGYTCPVVATMDYNTGLSPDDRGWLEEELREGLLEHAKSVVPLPQPPTA